VVSDCRVYHCAFTVFMLTVVVAVVSSLCYWDYIEHGVC